MLSLAKSCLVLLIPALPIAACDPRLIRQINIPLKVDFKVRGKDCVVKIAKKVSHTP